MIAGRLSGVRWPAAAAIGVLMNTRGLVELVILNIGLNANVISPTLYAIMVLMTCITTVTASPLLTLIARALGTDGMSRLCEARMYGRHPSRIGNHRRSACDELSRCRA
jgi:Kef-type K+ transport system membrane component KefB